MGRPKGVRNRKTVVHDIAKLKHRIPVNGKARKVSTVELIFLVVRQKALQGDVKAFALQEEWFSSSLPADAPPAIRWIIPVMERDEWEKMMALDQQAEKIWYSRIFTRNETRALPVSAAVRRRVGQKPDPGSGRDR